MKKPTINQMLAQLHLAGIFEIYERFDYESSMWVIFVQWKGHKFFVRAYDPLSRMNELCNLIGQVYNDGSAFV